MHKCLPIYGKMCSQVYLVREMLFSKIDVSGCETYDSWLLSKKISNTSSYEFYRVKRQNIWDTALIEQ